MAKVIPKEEWMAKMDAELAGNQPAATDYCNLCGLSSDEEDAVEIQNGVCILCHKKYTGEESFSEPKQPGVEVIPETPTEFSSFEEMNAFLAKAKKGKVKISAGKKAESAQSPNPENALVYQAVHFYVREGDTWQKLLNDAKEEKRIRNNNILVWAHDHNFGQACSKKCREVKE